MQHASEVQGCWEKLNFDHPLLNLLRYLNALESFFNLSKTEVDAADIAAKLQDILRPNESGACSSLEGCSPRLGETPRRGGATERRVTSHKSSEIVRLVSQHVLLVRQFCHVTWTRTDSLVLVL